MIESVFFDLDGLLADTEELHIIAYEDVAKKTGIAMSRGYIQSFIGRATKENIWQIIQDFNITSFSFEELLQLRYDSYGEVIQRVPIALMEGALVCIERVAAQNLRRALVTLSMKEQALSVLENISKNLKRDSNDGGINLVEFFHTMVFGNEVSRPKPDPEIYLEALKRTGIAPVRCVALEDSEVGVISAKRAGLYVIAVPNVHTKQQNFEMADLVYPSLREVAKMEFLNL